MFSQSETINLPNPHEKFNDSSSINWEPKIFHFVSFKIHDLDKNLSVKLNKKFRTSNYTRGKYVKTRASKILFSKEILTVNLKLWHSFMLIQFFWKFCLPMLWNILFTESFWQICSTYLYYTEILQNGRSYKNISDSIS